MTGCQADSVSDEHELVEWRLENCLGDPIVEDVELLEDRQIHQLSLFWRHPFVEPLGIVQNQESILNQSRSNGEPLVRLFKLLAELVPLAQDDAKPLLDLGRRQIAVSRQINQVLFLSVEPHQFVGQLLMPQLGCLLFVFQDLVKLRPCFGCKITRKVEGSVKVQHGVFNRIPLQIARGAEVLLLATAEEVQVRAAVPFGPLHDHPRFDAVFVALATPQGALQVMAVPPLAHTVTTALVEHGLDSVKQLVTDERLMSTKDQLAFVADVPDVVRIPQQGVQLAGGHQTGRIASCPRSEPPIGEFLGQTLNAEVAAGVQLEGRLDERRSSRIELDDSNVAPF